jgi:hypothetical protein
MEAFLHNSLLVVGGLGALSLCLVGLVMSALSMSGTWFVVGAAAVVALLPGATLPGWGTVLVFALISGAVEGVEAIAGAWGVKKRGGSNLAGVVAMIGGIVGMILGGFIPPPLVGSLLGMLVGSFVPAWLVERHRLQENSKAVHIAWGAVLARVLVILLKLCATLGMTIYLAITSVF